MVRVLKYGQIKFSKSTGLSQVWKFFFGFF